jgi:hypothetical protein
VCALRRRRRRRCYRPATTIGRAVRRVPTRVSPRPECAASVDCDVVFADVPKRFPPRRSIRARRVKANVLADFIAAEKPLVAFGSYAARENRLARCVRSSI